MDSSRVFFESGRDEVRWSLFESRLSVNAENSMSDKWLLTTLLHVLTLHCIKNGVMQCFSEICSH